MRTVFTVFLKIRNWRRHFYLIPWCVPVWGWREFLVTCECMLTGRIVRGPYPLQAANAIRDYLGVQYVIPVNRGRTAIELALRAMQLGENDDVVLPSYICCSVLDSVLRVRAKPIFADVGPDLNVTAETVKAAITPKTRCVIVAHLFGKPAPIDEITTMLKGTGIAVIDDAAQSFGARCAGHLVGTFGACGIISCGPGKPLPGPAGGFLVANSRELYERAAAIPLGLEDVGLVTRRILSFWVWRRFRRYTLPLRILLDRVFGTEEEPPHVNCTMSNIDGSIALQQIQGCTKNALNRRRNAGVLLCALGDMAKLSISDLSTASVPVKLVLVFSENDSPAPELISSLAQIGIECQMGYVPIHLTATETRTTLPITEALWTRVVCIPLDTKLKKTTRLALLSGKRGSS